ncbi:MAG TPA: hypothetical protein VNY10_14760 [Roseiarcus sp.]|jgi:hypothetical protein|nr:hypothetical protein [Roseiarcus sp.]
MRIVVFGALAFAVIFGGGLLGFLLSPRLPESYNDAGTRAVVTTAMRTVSLLSALVLGLLVATAKNKFDSNNAQTERFAADAMSLNLPRIRRRLAAADANSAWRNQRAVRDVWTDRAGWRKSRSVNLARR